jgi:hypothetical protein
MLMANQQLNFMTNGMISISTSSTSLTFAEIFHHHLPVAYLDWNRSVCLDGPGVWGCPKAPSGSRAKPWWGPRGRSPWKLKDFNILSLKIERNIYFVTLFLIERMTVISRGVLYNCRVR